MKNKWRNKNFFNALKNALNGMCYTIKNENNIKIQLVIAIVVIIMSIIFKISIIEACIIIITIFFVLFAEFVNTAIEATVDLYTEEYNEKAKIAKDVAAAGVTLSAISSVIVGVLIFLPKIIKYL